MTHFFNHLGERGRRGGARESAGCASVSACVSSVSMCVCMCVWEQGYVGMHLVS